MATGETIGLSEVEPKKPAILSQVSFSENTQASKRRLPRRYTDVSQMSEISRRLNTPSEHRFNADERKRQRWERLKLNCFYFEWMFGNSFMRLMFRLLSFVNLLTLIFNSVPVVFRIPLIFNQEENVDVWLYYYYALLILDIILAVLFTVYVIARGVNACYWTKHSSKPIDFASYYHWSRLVTIAIITLALYYSVAIEIYRLACIRTCKSILGEDATKIGPPYACPESISTLSCPPPAWLYIPFIVRLLSIFSAIRALVPFRRLRISNNVLREFTRYLKVKHLANVAIFYGLMIFIYAVIGVNVIGPLSDRCVDVEGLASSAGISLDDLDECYEVGSFYNAAANESRLDGLRRIEENLAIPDRHCRRSKNGTVQGNGTCPNGLTCLCLKFPRNRVYQADYPEIGTAFLSVYESSTLELWTRTLYDAIDGELPEEALLFFFSMVFFLVILVQESIFLVVIIESFAAVRSESYIERKKIKEGPNQYLVDEGDGKLRLVQKEDSAHNQWRLKYQRYLEWFHKAMLILVLLDAVIMATRSNCSSQFFDCDVQAYGCYLFVVALWQLLVSVVFAVEVVVYLIYYGPRKFFRTRLYWALMILAVVGLASAIVEIALARFQVHGFNCGGIPVPGLPTFTPLIVAQACRLIRLLSLYGPLNKFKQQVVGKDKRIYLVSLAVISFIFIMAVINVQIFAFVNRNDEIEVFPDVIMGFQSQFQLLFQEGWIELLSELMHFADETWVWALINLWIVFLHLVASLILLNFFIAIILDNLDLDEETKVQRLKEALAAETVQEETIPRHWKWSTIIGGGAETVKVPEQSGFDGPAVKKSVMLEYLERGETKRTGDYITVVGGNAKRAPLAPWQNQGSDDEEEDMAVRYRLRGDQSGLRLVSTSDTGRRGVRPMAWGQRERQQSVGHIIQQIKLLRKLRRFDVSETVKESTTRKAIRISRRSNTSGGRANQKVEEYRRNHRCFDRALFCMPPDHPVRKLADRILNAQLPEPAPKTPSASRIKRYLQRIWYYFLFVVSIFPFFKWFILLTTVGLITMQFVEGLGETSSSATFKATGDALFVVVTLSELILKIVAHGLLFNPYAAISSVLDVLDWIIVVATFVRFLVVIIAHDVLKTYTLRLNWGMAFLLVLWSLRPLRIISIVPQVREVLTDVWRGRQKFFFAVVLFVGFVFFFSSLTTQLFSGSLGKCNDIDVLEEEDCIGEFEMAIHTSFDIIIRKPQVTITVPRVWITQPRDFRFDNILSSFVTLFSLLPLEGWIALRDYLDVKVETHNGPSDIVNQLELKFVLHLYVFIGANLGLALFVGVIVANYNENKSNHAALLTVGQKQWLDLLQIIQLTSPKKIPPAPPYTKRVAYFVYSLVNDFQQSRYCQLPKWIRPFRAFSVIMIVGNALTLSVRWTENLELVEVAIGFSIAFNVWFIVEQFLKVIAFGFKPYFYSFRNWVDCLLSLYSAIYCICALVVLLENNPDGQESPVLTYENLADMALASAVLRCLTILGKYEVLTSISITVVVALLNSISLMVLMVVVLLVYAFWGTALFGQVTKGEGIELNHANFRAHNSSLYLGIRILTGEDWYQLMWDTAVEPPYCRPDLSNCGQVFVSALYFLSFFFILFFIILNIFKAVLLEAFSVFYSEDDTKLNHNFLKRFRKHWSKFDRTAKGIIPLRQARFLIRSLAVRNYYSYRVKDNGERERVEVDMISDALVLREMYHELVLTVTPELKLNEESDWHPGQKDIEFASVLRMLAYKAEDMHKRLKPDELVEREVLEQSIQDEVAAHCIQLWMKRYLRTVVDNFSRDTEDQSFPLEGPASVPIPVIIHQSSLPTDTTEDEGEFPTRPQNLPLLPAKVKGQEGTPLLGQSTLSPHATHGPQTMFAPLARREPQPVDPNHSWLEQQMEYDSDDDALFDL